LAGLTDIWKPSRQLWKPTGRCSRVCGAARRPGCNYASLLVACLIVNMLVAVFQVIPPTIHAAAYAATQPHLLASARYR
jgi:hypothetical protein